MKKMNYIVAILSIVFVLIFGTFLVKAQPVPNVQFTADTIIDLSGLNATLYALYKSAADSLIVNGSTLTVEIPDGSTFNLGTASYKVLGLSPRGGTIFLIFDSANFSSGYASQWTEFSSISNLQVSHSVEVPQANTNYVIWVDGVILGTYLSNNNKEISFNYDVGYAPKVFTVNSQTTLDSQTTSGNSSNSSGIGIKTEGVSSEDTNTVTTTTTTTTAPITTITTTTTVAATTTKMSITEIKTKILSIQIEIMGLITKLIEIIQEQINQLRTQP